MIAPIVIGAPWSKDEIQAESRRLTTAADAFWTAFDTAEFLEPIGSAWSPADNVRHLVKSVRPVALALRMPRFLLAGLFGKALRPSRSLEEIRVAYRGVLAAGGQAGQFAPRPVAVRGDREAWRARLMLRRAAAEERLVASVHQWNEGDLDIYRVPHPLLGRLTVREMLFFSLYHGIHHVNNVARRKGLWTAV